MKRIHIYDTNDVVETIEVEKCPSLEELQEMVGGLIERTECLFNGQVCDMIINEEGLVKRLPFNSLATHFRTQYLLLNGLEQYVTPIVGNAVIFEGFELE